MIVRLQRAATKSALSVALGLLLLCLPGACAGPGLEPPAAGRGNDGPGQDAGAGPMAGGAAQSGAGGVSGQPPQAGTGGSPDSGDGDAGEAALDASVDEDGGSDPTELEP